MSKIFSNPNSLFRHPVILLVTFVLTSVGLMLLTHQTSPTFDAFILLFISLVYGLSVIFMIANTTWIKWTILGTGLLSTFTGDTILYFLFSSNYFMEEQFPYYPYLLVIVRALFIIGGVWILIGLIQEAWMKKTPETQANWFYYIGKYIPFAGRKYHGRNSTLNHFDKEQELSEHTPERGESMDNRP